MYEVNCTSDLQFNPASRTCDLPERVNCIVRNNDLILFFFYYSSIILFNSLKIYQSCPT